MGKYWNKLRVTKKKEGYEHDVYSITIPPILIKDTNWKKDDLIGFQKYVGQDIKGRKRFSFELVNLGKETSNYVDMTFLKIEQQNIDFIKQITPSNLNNFSPAMQGVFKARMRREVELKRKRNRSLRSKNKLIIDAKGTIKNYYIENKSKEAQRIIKKEAKKTDEERAREQIQMFERGIKFRDELTRADKMAISNIKEKLKKKAK